MGLLFLIIFQNFSTYIKEATRINVKNYDYVAQCVVINPWLILYILYNFYYFLLFMYRINFIFLVLSGSMKFEDATDLYNF